MGVAKLKSPGMYGDGNGLWLQITPGGKSWIFRFTLHGRAREMGLGSSAIYSLAEARERAVACRKLVNEGIDPIEARREKRRDTALDSAKSITFKECAEAYIRAHAAGWRNPKHAAQWTATLANYAYPVFGELPVAAVDTALVMRVLEPIWTTKTETASRVRGRIESVLDWAKTRNHREGENPARWRGHLQNLLPKRSKVQKVQHFPALPYDEIGPFLSQVRGLGGVAPRALEFVILTACRTGEVIGARWIEINLNERIWTIPAERMKAGREHRAPLSDAALAVLEPLRAAGGDYVFPGSRRGKPLSNMAMLELLKRIKREDLTVHGFRSTFRDWAAERTNFPREVAEAVLAHTLENKVEAAYRRGDLFEKRRELMDEWAEWCK
ncbi:tyrosine-type recombinase/integrase [Methylobacterium sp. WSM2598]|uniref:tyrosine-type recombinase/integrase n=1 Tax=Methylobacterium sp. WSM2598 TaxID=398261 RepID=UPI00036BFB6D|nr:site-specific integrase [Methylobacterium sp. WSM2598]